MRNLDFNCDGRYDALVDGIALLSNIFGWPFEDFFVQYPALGPNFCPQHGERLVDELRNIDFNGDGQNGVAPLEEGVLIPRFLAGLRGESMINGVQPAQSTYSAEQVLDILQNLIPPF